MIDYKIEVTFTSDKELTEKELITLKSILALQIEEPQDLEGNEEEWVASNIAVTGGSK